VVKTALSLVLWLVSLSSVYGGSDSPTSTALVRVDPHPAPAVELSTLSNEDYRLENYRNKVYLVHFWATWCTPCVKELPELSGLQHDFDPNNFQIIAIAADSHKAVREFLKKNQMALQPLIDQYGNAIHHYKAQAFPTTFLIDQKGMVRYQAIGQVNWNATEIRRAIGGLIAQVPGKEAPE